MQGGFEVALAIGMCGRPNAKQGDIAPKVFTSHTLHYSSLAVAECIALLIQPICLSYAQSEMDEIRITYVGAHDSLSTVV